MSSFIGVDLGTTNSAISFIDETGRPTIIHNNDGENTTASCVTEDEGKIIVGEFARRTWGIAPGKAAARFKRDMGGNITYSINNSEFTPTELSSFVLKKLVQDATNTIESIGEAVVTIPANFSNEARDATMAASKAAGMDVKYIINEPTAAALYYAFKNGEKLHGSYAVYDLGGGTFDVSIIKVNGQDIDVIASNGVSRLGGDDFDKALKEIVAKKYKSQTGEVLEVDDYTIIDAEEDKKSLSRRQKVTSKVNRQLINIDRTEFEEAISSRVAQAEMLCEATIEEAGIKLSDIQAIFLAGGSTRIPSVIESVRRVFQQEPISSINVDEVVALGASLYSAFKGEQSKLSVVQKNAIQKINVAESTSKCFGTISVDYNSEREEEALVNSILIKKNEKIPCSVTESFYTIAENQKSVLCRLTECTTPERDPRFVKIIWEGDLELPLGRPAGQEIKITYSYDENQMIKCSFVDVQTNRKTEVDLSLASGKDDDEIIDKFLVE